MILREFAFLISRIFNFYFWTPVSLLVTIFNTGLSPEQIKILLPTLLLLDVIVPILIFLTLVKIGKISDVSLAKREDRPLFFGLSSLIILFSTILSFFLANNLFFRLHLLMFILGLTLFLITLFFKISGHMVLNASFIFIINYLFDWKLLWIFLIVPSVAFARIYLKKHTLVEVAAGAIVGLTEPYLVLKFFKLL